MFAATYYWDLLVTKMKHTKSILLLQLSNHHLSDVILQLTTSFNPDIISFWFSFVLFYGISTIEGYFMPNPVYKYILNI